MRRRTPAHSRGGTGPSAATRARGALARLRGDERGTAAVMTAMAASSLLGIAGLAVEVGGWYVLKRNMQSAADAASMAAAQNLDATKSTAGIDAFAKGVTARNGFVHGQGGTAVSVASDPATGRVTVAVERPSTSVLLRAAGSTQSTKTVRALAAARVVDAGARPCVHALVGSVYVNNNADLLAAGCSLVSDSAAADAFDLKNGNGSGRVTAANIVTHGGCEGCVAAMEGGKLTLTQSPAPTAYAGLTTNPYAGLNSSWAPPASATTNCRSQPAEDKQTKKIGLTPGCYDKIDIKPSDSADMSPGVYYVYDGPLVVKGDLVCSACTPSKGVAIVMLGKNRGTPGQVDVSSQANVRLNASRQADSSLDGVLIYSHDPYGTQSGNGGGRNDIDFNAGSRVRLDGAVVSFTSRLRLTGGAATDANSCTVFVVASMELKGNSGLNLAAAGCDLYGTKTSATRIPRLVQ